MEPGRGESSRIRLELAQHKLRTGETIGRGEGPPNREAVARLSRCEPRARMPLEPMRRPLVRFWDGDMGKPRGWRKNEIESRLTAGHLSAAAHSDMTAPAAEARRGGGPLAAERTCLAIVLAAGEGTRMRSTR